MNKLLIISSAVAVIAGGMLVYTGIKKPSDSKVPELTQEVVMDLNRPPLACVIQKQKLASISKERHAVKNAQHMGFWQVEFESGQKVSLLTNNEEPYKVGQTFLIASDCKKLKADQTIPVRELLPPTKDPRTGHEVTNYEEIHKTQSEIASGECVNIYVLNKDKGQMKLECSHLIDDKVYVLAKTAKKESARK